jgi:hypothetical protein
MSPGMFLHLYMRIATNAELCDTLRTDIRGLYDRLSWPLEGNSEGVIHHEVRVAVKTTQNTWAGRTQHQQAAAI